MRVLAAGKHFSTFLVNDGSLDTVIRVQPVADKDQHGGRWPSKDIRFDGEYASQFRFRDGRMTKKGFRILSKEAADVYAMEEDSQ